MRPKPRVILDSPDVTPRITVTEFGCSTVDELSNDVTGTFRSERSTTVVLPSGSVMVSLSSSTVKLPSLDDDAPGHVMPAYILYLNLFYTYPDIELPNHIVLKYL